MALSVCIVTGAGGLIGSEAARFFLGKGFHVVGVDNDSRSSFFGPTASVQSNIDLLMGLDNYTHYNCDIRNQEMMDQIFSDYSSDIDLIIHCAAQPSHDWSADDPLTDFHVNTTATIQLLECFRGYCPDAKFIFMSTNKVYGDNPNRLELIELPFRYELLDSPGIDETMSLDHCIHSVFGANKAAADLLVQEYGKNFGLHTVCFRGGCLTGPRHQGAELHGFLSYLVKCVKEDKPYTVYGHRGKQVRDNIHSEDLINCFWEYYKNPTKGEAYNIGGGRESHCSLIEAVGVIEALLEKTANLTFDDTPRVGDHLWYVTDYSKFKKDFPGWEQKYNGVDVLRDLCNPKSQ